MPSSLPPSLQNIDKNPLFDHFWSWLTLIIFVGFLIYMAKIVIGEKTHFEEDGKWIDWNDLKFFIPSWWSIKEHSELKLSFYRSDTHYDWIFSIEKLHHSSIDEAKNDFLKVHDIVLDEDFILTKLPEYLLTEKETLKKVKSFERIETTATENLEERIYLDITWIKFDNSLVQFVSRSSVLNGGIEGPYVEEVLKRINFSN